MLIRDILYRGIDAVKDFWTLLPRLKWSEWAKEIALVRWARADREFLPSAIGILETPPSPIGVGLIWIIILMFVGSLTWSWFGEIDIIAIAQGKIQPTVRVKTIQPLETGRVVVVHVENGQHVATGEVLVELDSGEAFADESATLSSLMAYKAERERRFVALQAAENDLVEYPAAIQWPGDITSGIRLRQERILRGDLGQLAAALRTFGAQIEQKKEEESRLQNTIRAQELLIETLRQRVTMREGLLERGSTSKAAVIDAMEGLQNQQTTLAGQRGQLLEARASAEVVARERRKAIDTFIAENSLKLEEAERQIDELEQKLAKARLKTGRMALKSPISGTVLGLSVTTLGQVVSTSEELMRIVPDGGGLEIESYLENKDIGFLKPGQPAVVKIESFPFTRYGTIDATIVRVAHDAIPLPDAQAAEGNPAKTTKSSFFGGAQRVQNLVYPVTLSTVSPFMNVDGVDIPLSMGMAVTVEIRTGKRRIIDYLFSPLAETASRSMKER